MSPDAVAAIGSFLTGAGAVIGGFYTMGRVRKRMREECEERINALREGIKIGEHLDVHDQSDT
jgi:hypothetical protein